MHPIIIICGPTAVGKTSISIRLAQLLNTDIISADSMQVYKNMDIGTAKPSRYEQSLITHYMIDVIEPWEYFSAGAYLEAVIPIIEQLKIRQKIPIITGGTGLYMKAITRGLFRGPSAVKEIRQRLMDSEKKEPGILHKKLTQIDEHTASRVNPNDIKRIIRALEVWEITQKTMGMLQKQETVPLPYRFIKIGLTRHRDEIYRLINQRVDTMVSNGLFDEVSSVSQMILSVNPSDNPLEHLLGFTSMQAIGYKEILDYLYSDHKDRQKVVEKIKQRTRNYAKRQLTWFRGETDITWVNLTDRAEDDIIEEIRWTISQRLI
ncbi:MAG: tRNA (adenosine(37)-N6)-dimethylallyltransferase MiaA [Thermodesulfovibrionales bacterium]